jgi:hypothetical protein
MGNLETRQREPGKQQGAGNKEGKSSTHGSARIARARPATMRLKV